MTELSFIVVTHNRKDSLRRCLSSIVQQTLSNYEVLVVDNGSDPDCCAGLALEFPGIKFKRFSINESIVLRRTQALSLASSEICFVLDDDATLISPDSAQRALSYFSQNPSLAIVTCKVIDPKTGQEDYPACPRRDKKSDDKDYFSGTFSGCAYVCRKEHVNAVNGYWGLLRTQVEELDLTFRLYANGYQVLRSGKIAVAHFRETNFEKHLSWTRHQARNRALVAVRNLPLKMVFSQCTFWWVYLLSRCRTPMEFYSLFQGVKDFFVALPIALELRNPLAKQKLHFLNSISGRTWY